MGLFKRLAKKESEPIITNSDSMIVDFAEKLESIESHLSQMKMILFELSNGKYNPFEEPETIEKKLPIEPMKDPRQELLRKKKRKEDEEHFSNFLSGPKEISHIIKNEPIEHKDPEVIKFLLNLQSELLPKK
jgi:hypothetical protein